MTSTENTKLVPGARSWLRMALAALWYVGWKVMAVVIIAFAFTISTHWSLFVHDVSPVTGYIASTLTHISDQPLTVGSTILIGLGFLLVLNLWRMR